MREKKKHTIRQIFDENACSNRSIQGNKHTLHYKQSSKLTHSWHLSEYISSE